MNKRLYESLKGNKGRADKSDEARAIFFGEQAATGLQLFKPIGSANVGFVKMGGEERTNGHDGRKAQQQRESKERAWPNLN